MTTQPLAQQLSARRAEMMAQEVEAVAFARFEERGFGEVTVEEIASAAGISVRTFYRYFSSKEDILQLRIDRRTAALNEALEAGSDEDSPMTALRIALEATTSTEDLTLLRSWCNVIAASPGVLQGVVGGIQLKTQRVIAAFLARRLDVPAGDLVPTMLAAAVGGVVQAAHIQWYVGGGDLVATISDGLRILERGMDADPTAWASSGTASDR